MTDQRIEYTFILPGERTEVFEVTLDADGQQKAPTGYLPDWTRLEFNQCPNCPLNPDDSPHCPIAAQLADLVQRLDEVVSFDQIDLEIKTDERTVSQHTSAQQGASALMGLIMATSGCPNTAYFRPMARFHLPLASEQETFYRSASMYLLAQYYRRKAGQEPDFRLDGLRRIYEIVQVVNRHIAKRLRAAAKTDSAVNAVVLLDMFALVFPDAIEESLDDIRGLFRPFLVDDSI